MRTRVQGVKIIVKGDTSTTRGTVLTGTPDATDAKIEIALLDDRVFCLACKTTGIISEGTPLMKVQGIPVALEGHIVSCQCPRGSHRLVAR
ncbi:PAAR domain-containing protein [Metakosakonia massiliensis]|uniref:PAAR domain-containing protein n=1 Tax=Phytobacter massiliensis TaxID=1485952 RepID=A0A6N3AN34_9ENTR